jgi:hypothetical protein
MGQKRTRSRTAALLCFLIAGVGTAGSVKAEATKPGKYWVQADEVRVLLGPSSKAQQTNELHKRDEVDVTEVRGSWARVGPYYPGGSEGMRGMVARWVAAKDLSPTPPPEPRVLPGDPPVTKYLLRSDNFERHRDAFIRASQQLIDEKRCSLSGFQAQGGWMKDPDVPDGSVYFTYCGEMRRENRMFLNIKTGVVVRR